MAALGQKLLLGHAYVRDAIQVDMSHSLFEYYRPHMTARYGLARTTRLYKSKDREYRS